MAIEGIANLVQSLADHLFGQGPAVPAAAPVVGSRNVGAEATTEDTFTPSAPDSVNATAQASGIFQWSQGAPAAPVPGTQRAQPALSTISNGSLSQATSGSAPSSKSNAVHIPTGTAANSGAGPGQSASGPAASAQLQNEIQRLNASLPALGLTNNEIQQIDRIASMIKDFNPAAYTDLVNEFEAQSQQAARQNAPDSLQPAAPDLAAGLGQIANSQAKSQAALANGNQNPAANPIAFHAASPQGQQSQFAPSTDGPSPTPGPQPNLGP